ncbi:secondary thiamine-phosphate synthase enzyme YjbQ [Streptomyces sp. ISL-11]|uniref:secondary thiamine-phosphate synthase enzyme YjbQ n=1 Tax=Streptomyces sp. ISL-11 TaxID=2819174 RepID=UPI001BE9B330|nr:secondary thiamine-phosphate synthase enzyme YjbQ [Streptomyces sp. ISL-11]MBT2384334.1 YjbQ family protein [Streptomyces sp. ISL-11]
MTTVSGTRIDVLSREVLPTGSSIAVSARFSVTIGSPEDTVDLTGALRKLVAGAGVTEGTLHLYCGHTTCGLVINEREAGLESDVRGALERLAPHTDAHYYAHDKNRSPAERLVHSERDNGHSHVRAMVGTHPELSIPITSGSLYLGQWQAVMLAEFDGPRTRELLARVHTAM